MDFWGLLFIAVFQLLTSAVAAWDPLSPLILVNHPQSTAKVFPYVVERPDPNMCPVYDNYAENNTAITFVYCPNPRRIRNRKCNSVTDFFTLNDVRRRRRNRHGHNIQNCESEVEYHRIRVTDDGPEYCMHNGNIGRRYKFVYLLCDTSEIEEIQIYEMCYQENQNQIILGHFTIENPRLLRNPSLRDEQEHSFEFSTQPNHNYFLEKAEQLYYEILVNANHEFSQCHSYLPRSVLPHELFPHGHQRKASFNYMNVAPMDSLVLTGWELSMTRLRDRLSRMDNSIHVTAGLFHGVNVQYLGYIDGDLAMEIPDLWWTLLYNHDRTKGVAITMHDVQIEYMPFDESHCNPQVCQEANISDSVNIFHIAPYAAINCCYPQYIIDKFNLGSSPTYEILIFP